tara:strand:- start:2899 stop:3720 length:822 start_codon:yes stop_codon:yes gene_type:complete
MTERRHYEKNKEHYQKYHREYMRRYREENLEKCREREKKYYEENKENIRKWREENKEELAAKAKRYREENKETLSKKAKKYYEENKERIIDKYQQNKESIIYKITCPDGRYYIGSTVMGLEQRLGQHFGGHKDNSLALYLNENNYKREDIKSEILEKFQESENEKMRQKEYEIIEEYIGNPLCLNKMNIFYGGKLKYKGVFYRKKHPTMISEYSKPYVAQIDPRKARKKGVSGYVGVFTTEEEAARARDKREKELFGEKAILNFPEEHNVILS